MVTGRTRPKKYALTSAHRALRPKILFEVLHIIIKKLVLFLYDGVSPEAVSCTLGFRDVHGDVACKKYTNCRGPQNGTNIYS